MNKIDEAIKNGCEDCLKKTANEGMCMWGGFVGDCPYNTSGKSEPQPTKSEISSLVSAWDGDITDEQAREILLNKKPEPGEFTKGFRGEAETLQLYAAANDKRGAFRFKDVFEACDIIDRLTAENADLQRRVMSHIKGEAVKGFCANCRKPQWNVDDEDLTCPFCGWSKSFPVPDIDATQIV